MEFAEDIFRFFSWNISTDEERAIPPSLLEQPVFVQCVVVNGAHGTFHPTLTSAAAIIKKAINDQTIRSVEDEIINGPVPKELIESENHMNCTVFINGRAAQIASSKAGYDFVGIVFGEFIAQLSHRNRGLTVVGDGVLLIGPEDVQDLIDHAVPYVVLTQIRTMLEGSDCVEEFEWKDNGADPLGYPSLEISYRDSAFSEVAKKQHRLFVDIIHELMPDLVVCSLGLDPPMPFMN